MLHIFRVLTRVNIVLKQDKKRYIKNLGLVYLLLLNLISLHSAENLIKIHQKTACEKFILNSYIMMPSFSTVIICLAKNIAKPKVIWET